MLHEECFPAENSPLSDEVVVKCQKKPQVIVDAENSSRNVARGPNMGKMIPLGCWAQLDPGQWHGGVQEKMGLDCPPGKKNSRFEVCLYGELNPFYLFFYLI